MAGARARAASPATLQAIGQRCIANPAVKLGCADCHGGDAHVALPGRYGARHGRSIARPWTRPTCCRAIPKSWNYPSSANPQRTYTLLNRESPEFVRFMNPSDYRVVREACGACHAEIIDASLRSLHATDAMFWGGASYNNGILRRTRTTSSASPTIATASATLLQGPVDRGLRRIGASMPTSCRSSIRCPPGRRSSPPTSSASSSAAAATSAIIFPETGLPDAHRASSSGSRSRAGPTSVNPIAARAPARASRSRCSTSPRRASTIRICGSWAPTTSPAITASPAAPPATWCTPTTAIRGIRASYAPLRARRPARRRSIRRSQDRDRPSADSTPSPARFPTSQCMICHMHQPNMFMNSCCGYTMWDYESDAPAHVAEEAAVSVDRQDPRRCSIAIRKAPRRAATGPTSTSSQRCRELNPTAEGHPVRRLPRPWLEFPRGVQARPHAATCSMPAATWSRTTIRRSSRRPCTCPPSHVDVGMQCVDCHFSQDNHGNGYIYGEVGGGRGDRLQGLPRHRRARIPICTPPGRPRSAAAWTSPMLRTPDGRRRFEWIDGELYQRSMLDPQARMARQPGQGHGDARAIRTTTRRRHAPSS